MFLNWSKAGKTDYNFVHDYEKLYDGSDWAGRKKGQPFFAQIHLAGGKHRDSSYLSKVDFSKMELPPYYPEDPVIVEDWKQYLRNVVRTDTEVGKVMKRLEEEGILENTVVFFITDHGISHTRGKQFLYDEGTKIPFIVWGPEYVGKGVREKLTAHIDLVATSLYFAGIKVPSYMESKSLFGQQASPREYVVSARDRCDETEDRIRSIRTRNFKYIRNYYTHRPYLQPNVYKDHKPILKRMRVLHSANKLNNIQSLVMAESRPEEELYDLRNDPFEINNLAGKKILNPNWKNSVHCLINGLRIPAIKEKSANHEASISVI